MTSPAQTRFSLPAKFLVAAGAAFLLSLFFAVAGWWSANATLQAEFAQLRAQGLPTNARELNDFYHVPSGVPDDTSTWVDIINRIEVLLTSQRGGRPNIPIFGEVSTPIPIPDDYWEELAESRLFLKDYQRELERLRSLGDKGSQVRFPIDFNYGFNTVLEHTYSVRRVGGLLLLDAHVSAHDEAFDRTHQDIMAIFAASDAIRSEPTLVSQDQRKGAFAIGCQALDDLLPYCSWNDQQLASLQQAVNAADFRGELINAWHGERAVYLTVFERQAPRLLAPYNELELFKSSAIALEGQDAAWTDWLAQQSNVDAYVLELNSDRVERFKLENFLKYFSSLEQGITFSAQAEARQRCANAAIAVVRYRLKHDRLPEALRDIEPELLAADPEAALTDPLSGQPLRYKVENDRILIYSVGLDLIDDGGHCQQKETGPPATDVGYILLR